MRTIDGACEDVDRFLAQAFASVRADDLESARDLFARATVAQPDLFKAWLNYGAVCGELGRFDEAIHALETARTLDPLSHEATANLGVLHREAGRLELAETYFKESISMAPDIAFGHYNLGHTLFLAGRFRESASAYRAGLRRDPEKTPNQRGRLAWALLAGGDFAQAKRELRHAIRGIKAEESVAFASEAFEVLEAIAALQPALVEQAEALRSMVRSGLRTIP